MSPGGVHLGRNAGKIYAHHVIGSITKLAVACLYHNTGNAAEQQLPQHKLSIQHPYK